MSAAEVPPDEARLLAMCDAEFGWDIDTFIALTRRVLPPTVAERDRLKAQLAAARADALHEAAVQIEAVLNAEHAPPIWWRLSDIVHRLAGCEWDEYGGPDGFGEYDCQTAAASPSTREVSA